MFNCYVTEKALSQLNVPLTVILWVEVLHYTVGESKRSSGFNEMALSLQTCSDNMVTGYLRLLTYNRSVYLTRVLFGRVICTK